MNLSGSDFFYLLKRLARQGFSYFVLSVIFLVILADNYSAARKGNKLEWGNKESSMAVHATSKADSLVDFALKLKGIPYEWAGNSLKGFDCSGFTYFVFRHFNISIPRSSSQQYKAGKSIPTSAVKKGDLLFFTGTQNRKVGHVGIVITEYGEKPRFIHSSSGGDGRGVTIDSLSQPHYQARYLGARRII